MEKPLMPSANPLESFLIASAFLIFILPFAQSAYSGEFVLKEVDTHLEPAPHLLEPEIKLLGVDIKAASYTYIYDNEHEVGRLGFLIRGKKFYFVDSDEYNLYGDSHFGFYNDFFLMDSWGYGSTSGHVRLMFLCRYGKDSVQLLDVISRAEIGGKYLMDFMSSYKKEDIFITNPDNAWTEIKDIDHDGNPEIKIDISTDSLYFIPAFSIYLEIKDERLRVDLDRGLYKPLFKQEKKKPWNNQNRCLLYIRFFIWRA